MSRGVPDIPTREARSAVPLLPLYCCPRETFEIDGFADDVRSLVDASRSALMVEAI